LQVSSWYCRRRSSIILLSASHFMILCAFPTPAA
jgi:hypothetical protein